MTDSASPRNAYSYTNDQLSSVYADLMSKPNLSFRDKWDISQQLPGTIVTALTTHGGFPVVQGELATLTTLNARLQRDHNLFDPSSTLVVNDFRSAGAALAAFLPAGVPLTSVNPLDLHNQQHYSNASTFSESNPESVGYERVGTVFVADPDTFTAISEAYALTVQGSDGGFNTGALDANRSTYAPEVPTHELANGALVVAGGAMDALEFLARTHDTYENIKNVGQVNIYAKNEEISFEVVTNEYRLDLHDFRTINPSINSTPYNDVLQGLNYGK